ncbi:MAG TPA: translocation/assembly module TamB domain-containing protein, partial [Bacteroidales bacterium]|nr:translocation/assembly module TamB domain-containing protein [Bacteroidales bacterium]
NMVTSAVEHSGMELLTNSINNFISQNLKYVDIGLKYRNADDTHAEEYSISASTSLLNDRMIIEGSFGYANDKGKLNDNGNNFIGDYSMEYALNEDKNWRVKVFNVTNQYSSLTQTSPYAQGVAVIYKKEFNNKKDFVNKWKRKKKEKKRNKNNQ